jgi:hypothetical protein
MQGERRDPDDGAGEDRDQPVPVSHRATYPEVGPVTAIGAPAGD